MQLYQFDRIYSQMEKEFGKIKKGNEEEYMMQLSMLEGNVLKIHREDPNANSRRLREAIALALFDIKSHYTNNVYDIEDFRNEEIKENIGNDLNEEQLFEYYRVWVLCLLRIKESIDTWEKRMGSNGYFLFIEQYMG